MVTVALVVDTAGVDHRLHATRIRGTPIIRRVSLRERDERPVGDDRTLIGRQVELAALADLLDAAAHGPTSLGLIGPAGIGKTELLDAAASTARARRFRVAVLRPTDAEARVANAGLRDLLRQLGGEAVIRLPEIQQHALRAAVADADPSAGTSQLPVLAAVLAVLDDVSTGGPLLVAIDDLHWLDPSSAAALRFAARRVTGPVAILWTRRTAEEAPTGAEDLGDPHVGRTIGGLEPPALRQVVLARSSSSMDRTVVDQIVDLAAGNPFVAVQLAAVVGDRADAPLSRLPRSIDALIEARLGQVSPGTREVLAVASLVPAPTPALLRRATDQPGEVARALGAAEEAGIVELVGGAVRFTHPLLRHGSATALGPARRRAAHRRLADLVGAPEERARHLALAAIEPDPDVLAAIDAAAATTAGRGAPGEAAELLELGLALGADDTARDRARRVEAAAHRLAAGDLRRAAALLDALLEDQADDDPTLARARSLRSTVWMVEGDLEAAVAGFERAVATADDATTRVWAALSLAFLLTNTSRLDAARLVIERAERDQAAVGDPLRAATMATGVMVRYLMGDRIDWVLLDAAVEIEDRVTGAPMPSASRPSLVRSILLHMAGRLDDAVDCCDRLRRQLRDEGDEATLARVDFWATWIWCGLGRFDEADELVREATDRARSIGGPFALGAARSAAATVAAWRGDAERCRADADLAIEAMGPGSPPSVWPAAAVGLLELSRGDLAAALARYGPLAEVASAMGLPKGTAVWWTPEVVEVLAGLGRVDDARLLLDRYDISGLDVEVGDPRAVVSRCEGILAAAAGDLDLAEGWLRRAIDEHATGESALGRARTELHLGALLRRRGRRRAARDVLERSLATFETIGSEAWAGQARAELTRLGLRPRPGGDLTPSEREVALLVSQGLTNREVAGSLNSSPKTVEAHLTRTYRKLGVRTRAELAARVARDPDRFDEPVDPS